MKITIYITELYESYHGENGLGLLAKYATDEVEVMRTVSVAAATSAALKSKKRKKSPDGKTKYIHVLIINVNRMKVVPLNKH